MKAERSGFKERLIASARRMILKRHVETGFVDNPEDYKYSNGIMQVEKEY